MNKTWRPKGWETLPGDQTFLQQNLRVLTRQEAFEAGASAMLEALRKDVVAFIPDEAE